MTVNLQIFRLLPPVRHREGCSSFFLCVFVPMVAIPNLYPGPRGLRVTDVSRHAGAAGGDFPGNGNHVQASVVGKDATDEMSA